MKVADTHSCRQAESGLHESFTVAKDLKAFEFTFKAGNVAEKKNRLAFFGFQQMAGYFDLFRR